MKFVWIYGNVVMYNMGGYFAICDGNTDYNTKYGGVSNGKEEKSNQANYHCCKAF